MPNPPPSPRVDDLRDRLRALGYLDAGVDRFVLAPATGQRTATSIAWRSSLRIGLLAGALLGPAAAIGIVARLPGLVTGPRDAVVVALYLAALFGVIASAAAFVTAQLARRFAVRPGRAVVTTYARRVTTASGVAVGTLCLLYLTLWWRTASGEFAWSAPGWTAFALLVAATISLLLGHAVSVTALALVARADEASALAPRRRRSLWPTAALLGLAGFAGAGILLLSTTPGGALSPAPDFAIVPTGLRVTVVAIDGFDTSLAERLAGEERLLDLDPVAGVWARARLEPADTSDPARLWTTIATGQPADVHGVTDLETRRVAGVQGAVPAGGSTLVAKLAAATDLLRLTRPALASDDQRRIKTFWEVAAEKGLRTVVVNWWATWPAPAAGGVVLSDRAVVRLERGGALDAEVAPADLYPRLQSAYPGLVSASQGTVAAAFPAFDDPDLGAVIRRSAELDALLVEIARHPSLGEFDLRAVYLPGLDIAQHALLAGPGSTTASPSAIGARVLALEAYYRFLDALIARLAGPGPAVPDGTLLAVVTQPGRGAGGGQGLLALRGRGVRENAAAGARVTDIAPTVLHALGLPSSRELAGRPLGVLFDDAFSARHPIREVDRYGPRLARPTERRGQPLDEEMIERMRSLGYVR